MGSKTGLRKKPRVLNRMVRRRFKGVSKWNSIPAGTIVAFIVKLRKYRHGCQIRMFVGARLRRVFTSDVRKEIRNGNTDTRPKEDIHTKAG